MTGGVKETSDVSQISGGVTSFKIFGRLPISNPFAIANLGGTVDVFFRESLHFFAN